MAETEPAPRPDEVKIFDHGFVRLDDCMADDLSVVNSARVSFAVRKEQMDDRDKGLIKFLMRESHGTPFEHNSFRFHVRCPIFVAREWARHRIASINEESSRYHQLEDDFYLPEPDAVRQQVGRPGAYTFDPVPPGLAGETIRTLEDAYRDAYEKYVRLVDKGVAKELARTVLPFGIYTQFYWTVNARSLMNFISLRNAESAQYEIRVYARTIEGFFAQKMPVTYECFLESGRKAP